MAPKRATIFAVLFGLYLVASGARLDSRHIRPRFSADPGRIVNGTVANMEATRHQVSLRRRLNDGYFFGTGHICGGSLIRPNVVLSAAHCFVDQIIYDGRFLPKEDFIVVMGNLDRFETANTLTFDIDQLILQLDIFDLTTYNKDIALLILSGSVPANHPTIRPIALSSLAVPAETVCQVTGWGTTEEGFGSDVLMTLDVPMLSDAQCINDSALGHLILPGMICAGYMEGERDACNGDSGGPLVCQSQLAGVVSWGIGCAQPDLPGVYTEVSYYYEWIIEQISEANGGDGSGEGSGEGSGDGSGEGSGETTTEGSTETTTEGSPEGGDDGVAIITVTYALSVAVPVLLGLSHFS